MTRMDSNIFTICLHESNGEIKVIGRPPDKRVSIGQTNVVLVDNIIVRITDYYMLKYPLKCAPVGTTGHYSMWKFN